MRAVRRPHIGAADILNLEVEMQLVKTALILVSILFAAVGSLLLVTEPGAMVVAWFAGGIWALAAVIVLELKRLDPGTSREA